MSPAAAMRTARGSGGVANTASALATLPTDEATTTWAWYVVPAERAFRSAVTGRLGAPAASEAGADIWP